MTINNRIGLLINSLGLNNNSFSTHIGVNPTVIHNIVKGRNAPSYDIITKIALSFDNICLEWLILEKGEMFHDKIQPDKKYIEVKEPPGIKHVLTATKEALLHAEAEIESRKETNSLLVDKIRNLEEKIHKLESALDNGQKKERLRNAF